MPHSPTLLRPKRPNAAATVTEPPEDRDIVFWVKADTEVYQDDPPITPATADEDPISAWQDLISEAFLLPLDTYGILHIVNGITYVGLSADGGISPANLANGTLSLPNTYTFAMAILLPNGITGDTLVISDTPSDKQITLLTTTEILEWRNDQSNVATAFTLESSALTNRIAPYIICGRTGQALLKVNNSTTDSTTETATVNWTGVVLGATAPSTTNLYIAEIIIWGIELTESQMTQAYQYLHHKYG